MNARAVKKHLMRGRVRNFWGRRTYMRISLPLSIIPTPPPPPADIPEGFKEGGWSGFWQNADESESIHINRSSCGFDPTELTQRAPYEQILFAEFTDNHWVFWSGHRTRKNGEDENGEPTFEFTPLDEALVAQHKAYSDWHDKLYFMGQHPVMDAFNMAHNAAKSMYWTVVGQRLIAEYGVKWFYPDRKLHFCSAISHAMRVAKKHGIKARILRR